MSNNRVVITGMGAITPIGKNVAEFEEGLKAGKNGISKITHFDTSNYKVSLCGSIKDLKIEDHIDAKTAKRMDRFTQLAMIAADEMVADTGINFAEMNTDRVGMYVTSGVGGLTTLCNEQNKLAQKGPRFVSPFLVPMMITNIAPGYISIKYGIKGASMSHVTACSSSTHAIGEAFRAIKHGYLDSAFAGGAESAINELSIAGFQNMTALNTSSNENEGSLPFDRRRNGFIMGEGAGILYLENYDVAVKRGAKIYAEIVGYGATSDAYHITSPAPDGKGAARAMALAIEEAGITPEKVDYINAHGTGTPLNDKFETLAIKEVFKDKTDKVLVNSTKSMTGHLLGGTGAVEAIASIMQMRGNYVHATINCLEQDEECDLNVVKECSKANIEYALSNSLGFGGHNGTILLKKFKS